jgi:hypothetical protein
MSPAPKQSASQADVEQTLTRIRELNEQILEKGREWGIGFLDAYEQTLKTFAEYQTEAADATGVEWVSDIARAQADFLREVTESYPRPRATS